MTTTLSIGEFKFLVVKGTGENELSSDLIEELKSGLDSLTSGDINDVFKVYNNKELQQIKKHKLFQFTHIIANSIEFPNYETATTELLIPVVRPQWLQEVIKNKKIEPLRPYSPNPRHIFMHSSIFIYGGLTDDDTELLKCAIKTFGGLCFSDLKKTLTHYVTNDTTDDNAKLVTAFNEINADGRMIHIVKPSWVYESILTGKIAPEEDHRFEKNNKKNKPFHFKLPGFLKGLSFSLSNNLDLSDVVKSALTGLEDGVKSDDSIYLTRFINTKLDSSSTQRTFDYFFALLFHQSKQLEHNSLLYYPCYKEHIADMNNVFIAATNYTGDSRAYIEELILRMGGKFGKTLKNTNTHLVASKNAGKKIEYAKKWGAKIVSHVWIEDSYVNWKILDESDYTKLPRDYDDVRFIDDVPFDGFKYSAKDKKIVDDGNIIMDSQVEETDDQIALTEESIRQQPDIEDLVVQIPKLEDKKKVPAKLPKVKSVKPQVEVEAAQEKEETPEKPVKQARKKSTKKEEQVTEEKVKVEEAVKPKEKATKKKEPKEKKEAEEQKTKQKEVKEDKEEDGKADTSIWDIPDDKKEAEPTVPSKRSSSIVISDDENDEESKTKKAKKQAKTDKPYNISAIVTGFDGELSLTDKRELKKIGIIIVDNSNKNLNCIIAPSLLRTQKFLTALSYDPEYILEPLFLTDVLGTLDSVKNVGEFESIAPKVEAYDIWENVNFDKDITPKRLFHKNTTREQAIKYMQKPRKGLFEGYVFNLSPGLAGGFDTLKSILKSFGCKQCILFKDNTKNVPVNTEKDINGVADVAVLVCSAGENKIQKHFVEVCRANKVNYVVLEWDVIVTAIFEASLKVMKGNVLQENGVLQK